MFHPGSSSVLINLNETNCTFPNKKLRMLADGTNSSAQASFVNKHPLKINMANKRFPLQIFDP